MKNLKKVAWTLSIITITVACNRDKETPTTQDNTHKNGVLVANEGNYGKPNAEISYISYNLDKTENDIYKNINDENLGDVLQSIGFEGENAYLVLNNSNKIIVADRHTFKKKSTVSQELKFPRYIAFAEGKYFVTNAQNGGYVSVYNLADNHFITTISINKTSERIVKAGENLFVQNASFGTGNQLTIISPKTNSITQTIQIPQGNIKRTVAYQDNVYVLSATNTDAFVFQYSASGNLAKTYNLPNFSNAKEMDIDNNILYFTSGTNCFAMPLNATTPPTTPLFTVANNSWSTFYGFNVINGYIYTSDAKGFTENSEISIYSTSGHLIKQTRGGIGTNGFYKN